MTTTEKESVVPPISPETALTLAQTFYQDKTLITGERVLDHAVGMANIIKSIRDQDELVAACYGFWLPHALPQGMDVVNKALGPKVGQLIEDLARVDAMSYRVRTDADASHQEEQAEGLRRMLLAMSRDIRVVLLKLASRLQTLRWFVQCERQGQARVESEMFAQETQDIYAPLANRLGIWQIKWELEDLSLRFTHPEQYHEIAAFLVDSREGRLEAMAKLVEDIRALMQAHHIEASVSGRPKHIYSIWKKMQRKKLRFDQLFDVRAVRVIVSDVQTCYEVLSIIHEHYEAISKEYDDYIANPKPNGYRSLHTVIKGKLGRPVEIQIRTQEMHDFAELGVAAHWRYKERGNSDGGTEAEENRVQFLRQLLAWTEDVAPEQAHQMEDDRVYVLTPQGRIVELPKGATPVDFAYMIHTELGHRTRGAKIDGVMSPLNTPLKTGQTVNIIAAKTGQPSRDWLMPELGYCKSPRTLAKVRQWFNVQQNETNIQSGRERLDKELARMGKTAVKLDDLAHRLGFQNVDELCLAFHKEELNTLQLTNALMPPEPPEPEGVVIRAARQHGSKNDVLVVGVDDLLTQLAKCCHPVPPDDIIGYVTRGRGVSIHRRDCPNVRNLDEADQERLIAVSWGAVNETSVFPVKVLVIAHDNPGLLKDVSEVFLREKQNVIEMQSQRVKGDVHLRFTVEIRSLESLQRSLQGLSELKAVIVARRA